MHDDAREQNDPDELSTRFSWASDTKYRLTLGSFKVLLQSTG